MSNAELAAVVATAWQEYASTCTGSYVGRYDDLYSDYRALADELEQATGFAVTCGALTGRPA